METESNKAENEKTVSGHLKRGVICTPYDEVGNISFMKMDRWGNTEDVGYPLDRTRISVFVTSAADSHHIEYKEPIERHKLATLFDDLAARVRRGI